MPWKIVRNDTRCKGKPFAVVKKTDNKLAGCHTTRDKATAQIAALIIAEKITAEKKEFKMSESTVTTSGYAEVVDTKLDAEKEVDEVNGVPIELISYASYEAMEEAIEKQEKKVKELTSMISPMVDNVIADEEIDNDKGIRNVFSGFMKRLSGLVGKKLVSKKEKQNAGKNRNTFTILKGKDGQMLWIASYSNNIRDEDSPPEIIASESHKGFVQMVDKGETPLPELWLWHCPELVLGKATTVAYDEESGCAVAAGYFNKIAEPIATAIQNSDVAWGVSHGMPAQYIKRSDEDPTIIIQHVTKEISPLPAWAAANKLAGFTILKEVNMALTDEKRQQLIDDGFSEADLNALAESLKGVSDMADNLGMERKEEDAPSDPPESDPEKGAGEDEQAFTEDQVAQLKSVFEAFGKQFAEQISTMVDEKIAPVAEAVAQKEKDIEEQVKHTLANTPAVSQSALFADVILGKQLQWFSATEADEAKLDGRTKLAKDGPEETMMSDTNDPLEGGLVDILTGTLPGQVR